MGGNQIIVTTVTDSESPDSGSAAPDDADAPAEPFDTRRDTAAEAPSTRWEQQLHAVLGTPPTHGNRITVLRNGDEIFPAMLTAIRDARHTVDLVTFVYWKGQIAREFAAALSRAARRGCRVRVLLDALGARLIDEELTATMEAAGCELRWFRPVADRSMSIGEVNHRTHRKILVCDGTVGFTGGVGIAEEWTGDARDESEWRDTHVEVRGPAVAGLLAAFIDNWADESHDGFDPSQEHVDFTEHPSGSTCFVHRGSSETGASDIWRLVLTMLTCAEHRVRIATAYFNPDERLCAELQAAAQRGVDVQILLPGKHADKRFVQVAGERLYQELLDAGVSINTYETSMMHAKIVTVDGLVASVGSANLNQRSMQHDEETNLVVLDERIVRTLDHHFTQDLERSVELDPARWADRNLRQKVIETASAVADRWL